jgi:hypothetical protein
MAPVRILYKKISSGQYQLAKAAERLIIIISIGINGWYSEKELQKFIKGQAINKKEEANGK